MSQWRTPTSALLAATLLLAGCGETKVTPDPVDALTACRNMIASGKPKEVAATCLKDAYGTEGVMLAFVAEVQLLLTELSGLLSFVSGAPGELRPQLDIGQVLEGTLEQTRRRLVTLQGHAATLQGVAHAEATLSLETAPVNFDMTALLGLISDEDYAIAPGTQIDLGGVWTKVPIMLIGSASAGAVGVLETLLAHELNLDVSVFEGFDATTRSVATLMMVANPEKPLLSMRDADKLELARLHFLVLLTFLAGEDALGGIVEVFDAQITADADQSNHVIGLKDADGNGKFGKGDSLVLKEVPDFIERAGITNALDYPIFTSGELKNSYTSRESMDDLTALGQALRAELAGESASPVPLAGYLATSLADLGEAMKVSIPTPKEWLAVRPSRIFANQVSIRRILPAIYAVDVEYVGGTYRRITDGTTIAEDILVQPKAVRWDFLIECETGYTTAAWADTTADLMTDGKIGGRSPWRTVCGDTVMALGNDNPLGKNAGKLSHKAIAFADAATSDSAHFIGQVVNAPMAPVTDATLTGGFIFGLPTADLNVPADGLTATNAKYLDVPVIPYIAFQDASLGGALLVDGAGAGDYAPGTNASLSRAIADMVLTYTPAVSEYLYRDAK